MKYTLKIGLIVAALASASALAQNTQPATTPTSSASIDCPTNGTELPLEALFGRWQARFEGLSGLATVQLARHPEYEGVRGTITRQGDGSQAATVAQLAGDIDADGLLSLDESKDGVAISGVWQGELQAASCGKEFKGVWRDAADDNAYPFMLTKTGQP